MAKYRDDHQFIINPGPTTVDLSQVEIDAEKTTFRLISMKELREVAKKAGFTLVRSDRIREFHAEQQVPEYQVKASKADFWSHMHERMGIEAGRRSAEECGRFTSTLINSQLYGGEKLRVFHCDLTVIDRSDTLE